MKVQFELNVNATTLYCREKLKREVEDENTRSRKQQQMILERIGAARKIYEGCLLESKNYRVSFQTGQTWTTLYRIGFCVWDNTRLC